MFAADMLLANGMNKSSEGQYAKQVSISEYPFFLEICSAKIWTKCIFGKAVEMLTETITLPPNHLPSKRPTASQVEGGIS